MSASSKRKRPRIGQEDSNSKSKKLRIVKKTKCSKSDQKTKAKNDEKFLKYQLIDFVKNIKTKPKEEIDSLVRYMGFIPKKTIYDPLTTDVKQIIRLDAYGFISIPPKNKLSNDFVRALDYPAIKPLRPKDYNLKNIPCWKYIELFPNFKDFHIIIKKALVMKNINPKYLSKMNFQDISYLYGIAGKKGNKAGKKDKDGNAIKPKKLKKIGIFVGAKYKFGKSLANDYTKEYAQILHILTNDKKEVRKYMNLAKEKGVLHPKLQVHHNETVLNANCLEDISKINNPSNFVAVIDHIHKFIHSAYDNTKIDSDDKNIIEYAFNKNDIIVIGRNDGFRVKRKENESRVKVIKMKPDHMIFNENMKQNRMSRG